MAVGLTTIAVVFAIGGDHLRGIGAIIAIVCLLVYTGSSQSDSAQCSGC